MHTSTVTRRSLIAALSAVPAVALVAGCSNNSKSNASESAGGGSTGGGKKLAIFATTGYLADAAKVLDPDAEITTMVMPGGDPHTYEPTTQDIEKMQSADAVFSSGVHLEAKMLTQLESLGSKHIAVGNKIDQSELLPWPEKDDQGNDLHDPHIWNSTKIWQQVVTLMAEHLKGINPDKSADYDKNAEAYKKQIEETDTWAKQETAKIPEERRVLVTGHDAFNYFGRAYGIEIHATDFVTSEADMSAEDIAELADLIATHKLPVIFQDNLKNPQAIQSVKEAVAAKGWQVEVSDQELYADSLGSEAGVDSYLGVLKHNVTTIVEALSR